MEELVIGGVNFRTHDLGGHAAARRLWKDYYSTTDGIVYLVDCADGARFPEAKEELSRLLTAQELSTVPFLVLGNKIDLKQAVSERDLKASLGIERDEVTGKSGRETGGRRPLEVFMCSVVKRTGYRDGFKWLANYLD
jgi:GTP-binding protein SAR1